MHLNLLQEGDLREDILGTYRMQRLLIPQVQEDIQQFFLPSFYESSNALRYLNFPFG